MNPGTIARLQVEPPPDATHFTIEMAGFNHARPDVCGSLGHATLNGS